MLMQDKSLSNGLFFLELLSAVEPRVVNWNLVTKGESGMLPLAMFAFPYYNGYKKAWLPFSSRLIVKE